MTCDDCEADLGDHIDGTLDPARAAAIEAHVSGCPACLALLEDVRAIRRAARALDGPAPPAHVWTRLADAFVDEQRARPWWRLSSGAFAWRPAAAAAVMSLLLAGSSWLAWREAMPTRPPAATPFAGTATETELRVAEQDFTAAIATLAQVAGDETAALDDSMAHVVRTNLAVIDVAIDQSREALRVEPTNELAQENLFDALRRKVQFLQDIVALVNEMRKGDTEGAARVISEMHP